MAMKNYVAFFVIFVLLFWFSDEKVMRKIMV